MTDVAFPCDSNKPDQGASGPDLPGSIPRSMRLIFAKLKELEAGRLDVILPNGTRLTFQGRQHGPHAVFGIKTFAFARRLGAGDVGLAEGYIAGEWECPSLVDLLQLLAANQALIDRFTSNLLMRAIQGVRHWLNRNTRAGSRRNIHAHYDLGNAFYACWLDPTMSYSSGLGVKEDLAAAQLRKYAAMAGTAGITADHHVLEIGCGWGGFAEYAAREIGCRVTAVTISQEQQRYAVERIANAGLADRVEIQLCDYRDITGQFDSIVSIEMFEAVGEQYWTTYFAGLSRLLKDGGRAVLQVITIREAIFPRYRREMDFIRRFIFPGGMLPTPTLLRALGEETGLAVVGETEFGLDYAETCRLWHERFRRAWPEIEALGFDERFHRIWSYYLAYCEAGFRAGTIDVRQIGFQKTGRPGKASGLAVSA
jgi:cyclopropane-fatty-acyl-phospholipid synthase